jgi:simple sugar transport system permease protein
VNRFVVWALKHQEIGPLVGLVALSIAFHLASGHLFFTSGQISAVAALSSSVGIVALGVTILMISGEFDLSVSATFALAPILMASLVNQAGWPPLAALLLAVSAASVIGLTNGLLTMLTGIPSFIATLGMLFAIKSVNRMLAGGAPVELLETEDRIIRWMGAELPYTPFTAPLIWMFGFGALLWFVLEHTSHGNATRAIGDQEGSIARAMGVPVMQTKLVNFVVCAVLAGLSGCLQLADFGYASVDSGRDHNLMAIVAVVIGGTSLLGVRGTVLGSLLGALLLGTLKSGLVLVGTRGEFYDLLIGVLLLMAAIFNAWAKTIRDRSGR